MIKQKTSFDSLIVDSHSGKGKFSLPTLRRYSSTTNLHQQENVNTPQILQRSLSSIFRKIPKNSNEKRENDTNSIDDDNASITSSDSSLDENDTKYNNKLISIFSGAFNNKGNNNLNNNHNKKKRYNFNEIIVSNEIIITTTDSKDFKDDENYGYINPTLTTYETHLHTPTHNYSFYYPCRSKSVPLLPKLSEEYSQLSRHTSINERELPTIPDDKIVSTSTTTTTTSSPKSSLTINVSHVEPTLSLEILRYSVSTSPLISPKLSLHSSSSPSPPNSTSLLPSSSSSPPLPPLLPLSSKPSTPGLLIIPNNNNNNCNNNIKTITNIVTTPTTPTEISESWPFARYPLRSTFYNLSDLPPSNPSPRSFNNSKISVTPPLKHSQSKSSTRSSRSKSVSRSLSKSSLRSKSLSRTHSKGSLRRSKSELFPPTIKKSYDPNHCFYGLCEKCKQPRTGILWCQSCYTTIFRKDFDNWTSGDYNIDEFIKKTQINSNNICELLEWIPFEKFRDLQLIGEGGYSIVYLAKWIDGRILDLNEDGKWERTGENDVILKVFFNSKELSEDYLNELEIYHKSTPKLNHVIRCYGISKDPFAKNTIMVMEYAKDGNLKNHLKNHFNNITWIKRISMINDITKSLKSIHSSGLIHKDLHSSNILIHDDYTFIDDLGLCTPKIQNNNNNDSNLLYGVMPYVAPEVLKGNQFTMKSDIYSFGMIMYEMITSLPPYHDYNWDENLLRDICDGIRPKIPEGIPNCYIELMTKCWSQNPEDRPNADYIAKILEDWKNNISQIEEFNIAEQFRLNQSNSIDIEKSVNYKSKALPKFYEILPTSSNE
ncbi:kinase-like protein [Rhizophagus irregularis]|uniref:Kinase-like protein n=1 Tax=Rhizophagus irregularis TaxID=588596 RepID=A0A2N0RV09_9GLOM|nr:kinase-like protein [Rhizophagus irregularis]